MAEEKNKGIIEPKDPKKILGNPTKDLFVFILTRDLSIEDAINDLIDNCIDGAKRLRANGNYKGLEIKISIAESEFKIEDNCGGISIDIARSYAFRFGRPRDMENTDYSIGQFGVGMKRAFFKMGKAFYVESKAVDSEFAIATTIEEWLSQQNENGEEDWSFEFQNDFKENLNNPIDITYTKIEITPLHDDVSKYIKETDFVNKLKSNVELKHMQNIYQGIQIYINGEKLECRRPEFLVSEEIKISEFTRNFENGVELRILCGIGSSVEDKGGWYIFCNDRLLLGPEQSELSGWTGKGGGGVANYHQQFWRFRGIVFFRAENSSLLPWNTSKNNIDTSSTVFLYARGKMIEMMKPVITLLNLLKKDNEKLPDGSEKQYKPYQDMIAKTVSVTLEQIKEHTIQKTFVVPKKVSPKENSEGLVAISFKKPKELVDTLKELTGVTSSKELGEYIFDYFIDMEEIDIDE